MSMAAETGRSLPRHRRLDGQGGSGFPLFSGERVSRRVAREWSELAGIEVIPQIGRDLGGGAGAVGAVLLRGSWRGRYSVPDLLVLLVWQAMVNELPRQNCYPPCLFRANGKPKSARTEFLRLIMLLANCAVRPGVPMGVAAVVALLSLKNTRFRKWGCRWSAPTAGYILLSPLKT